MALSSQERVSQYEKFYAGNYYSAGAPVERPEVVITKEGDTKTYATPSQLAASGIPQPMAGERFIEVADSGKMPTTYRVPESQWTPQMKQTYIDSGGRGVYGQTYTGAYPTMSSAPAQVIIPSTPKEEFQYRYQGNERFNPYYQRQQLAGFDRSTATPADVVAAINPAQDFARQGYAGAVGGLTRATMGGREIYIGSSQQDVEEANLASKQAEYKVFFEKVLTPSEQRIFAFGGASPFAPRALEYYTSFIPGGKDPTDVLTRTYAEEYSKKDPSVFGVKLPIEYVSTSLFGSSRTGATGSPAGTIVNALGFGYVLGGISTSAAAVPSIASKAPLFSNLGLVAGTVYGISRYKEAKEYFEAGNFEKLAEVGGRTAIEVAVFPSAFKAGKETPLRYSQMDVPMKGGDTTKTVWRSLTWQESPTKATYLIGRPPKGTSALEGTTLEGYFPKSAGEVSYLKRPEVLKFYGSKNPALDASKIDYIFGDVIPKIRNMKATAYDALPKKTGTLSEKGVSVVNRWVESEQKVLMERLLGDAIPLGKAGRGYGSYYDQSQLLPEYRRTPNDIDQMLNAMNQVSAERAVLGVKNRLTAVGENVRISKQSPTLIEAYGRGKWPHALDFHYAGEPTTPQTAESAWGITFYMKDIKIGNTRAMPIIETITRKGAASMIWREGTFQPEAHRMKDIVDFYKYSKSMFTSAGRDADVVKLEQLKTMFPQADWSSKALGEVGASVGTGGSAPWSPKSPYPARSLIRPFMSSSGSASRSSALSISMPSSASSWSPSMSIYKSASISSSSGRSKSPSSYSIGSPSISPSISPSPSSPSISPYPSPSPSPSSPSPSPSPSSPASSFFPPMVPSFWRPQPVGGRKSSRARAKGKRKYAYTPTVVGIFSGKTLKRKRAPRRVSASMAVGIRYPMAAGRKDVGSLFMSGYTDVAKKGSKFGRAWSLMGKKLGKWTGKL